MRQFLESATGVDIYLIISLFIFLIFFLGVILWLIKVDKKYILEVKQLPIDDSIQHNTMKGGTHV